MTVLNLDIGKLISCLARRPRGEAVIMTLVECQTRFAITVKLANKQAETINRAVKSLLSHRTMAQSSVACQT